MTQRVQRVTNMEFFNFDLPNKEGYTAEKKGDKLLLAFYPPLGSGYPDVKAAVQMKSNVELPTGRVIEGLARKRAEMGDQEFIFFAMVFRGGILPDHPEDQNPRLQGLILVFKPNGEFVKELRAPFKTYNDQRLDFSFLIENGLRFWDFERTRIPIEEKHIKQTIHPVDEETLTHNFTVEVSVPGHGKFSHTGSVSELRRKGLFGGKAPFFTGIYVWPRNGASVAFLKDHEGKINIAKMTSDGEGTKAKPYNSFTEAVRAANAILEQP